MTIWKEFSRAVLADGQVDITVYETVRESDSEMPTRLCAHFKLPEGSSFRKGGKVWRRTHYPVYWDMNKHLHPKRRRRVRVNPEVTWLESLFRLEDPRGN